MAVPILMQYALWTVIRIRWTFLLSKILSWFQRFLNYLKVDMSNSQRTTSNLVIKFRINVSLRKANCTQSLPNHLLIFCKLKHQSGEKVRNIISNTHKIADYIAK